MPKFEADYYAMVPEWGVVSLEAVGEEDFAYEADLKVRDLHEGATNIDIRNIKEVND